MTSTPEPESPEQAPRLDGGEEHQAGQEQATRPAAGVGKLINAVDHWQRSRRLPSIAYGVVKKFSDDEANLLVVALGWYGFTAIYPLLLVVVSVLGYIGVASLGHQLVDTLHQFPIIGQQMTPAKGSAQLRGSLAGLLIGVIGLLYGAQGVTQVAQTCMARVWNIPQDQRPGFIPRLGRSVGGLVVIGMSFIAGAIGGSYATAHGRGFGLRVAVILALLVIIFALYLLAFRVLTPAVVRTAPLVPGAAAASVSFTLLITVGTGLITHELRNQTATYGIFASVIGIVTFLLLLAKLTLYSAELNPVLDRRLYPRSLRGDPIAADVAVRDLRRDELPAEGT